jgi:hypothetical protein
MESDLAQPLFPNLVTSRSSLSLQKLIRGQTHNYIADQKGMLDGAFQKS